MKTELETLKRLIGEFDTTGGFFAAHKGTLNDNGLALRDEMLKTLQRAETEHAALVAVATTADRVIKANNVLLESQRQGDNNAMADAMIALYAELDALAAVRAGSEVAK